MKKVKQSIEGKSKICAEHPYMDYTLCGNALEGDSVDNMSEAIKVPDNTEITCKECKRLINYCKGKSDE